MSKKLRPIYTLDEETDPFLYQRTPVAFAIGLFDGTEFTYHWSPNCIAQMHETVMSLQDGIIFIHNGGKFDIYVRDEGGTAIMQWLLQGPKMTIINGRIVKAHIQSADKSHELRDSMALFPFSLKQYDKEDIDIRLLERNKRDLHRNKIVSYLKRDCTSLWELCNGFFQRFGDNLTVGGTAMKEIQKRHDFDILTEEEDVQIRDRFYFGGRVQCFEKGIIYPHKRARFEVYDINQSYPNAMRNFDHPTGHPLGTDRNIDGTCFFLTVCGYSRGCFPKKTHNGLTYPVGHGQFNVSIHEYNAALECGQFETTEIVETIHFDKLGRFDTFVDWAHGERKACQIIDDKVGSLSYKYVGNSGYGKFSQCPDNYFDYVLTDDKTPYEEMVIYDYEPCEVVEFAGYIIWRRKARSVSRYNVATGASITGAARSVLLRALSGARRPLYCDTDSIVCEKLTGVEIDDKKLGAWKIEKSGTWMAITGKKVYALFDGGECVKMASKGTRIRADEVVKSAQGMEIKWFKDAPTFDFKSGRDRYIKRTVRMT